MIDTVARIERHAADPIGLMRADLINFFAATALIGKFSLGSAGNTWFFFVMAGLTLAIVVVYWVIKIFLKYKKDRDIKENEVRVSGYLALFVITAALACGALSLVEGKKSYIAPEWITYNLCIACLVLVQIKFHWKRGYLVNKLPRLVLFLLAVLCLCIAVSSFLLLMTVAIWVVLAGLTCWLGLEAIGGYENYNRRKNEEEFTGIKHYYIKNLFQIVAVTLFIIFLLIINNGGGELEKNASGINFDDTSIVTVALLYAACVTTTIGVVIGIIFGFGHFLNKLYASNNDSKAQEVCANDIQVARRHITRRRDALKKASRDLNVDQPNRY